MFKALFILALILGALSFAYIVMTATPNDKHEYEMYQRWKEHKRREKK